MVFCVAAALFKRIRDVPTSNLVRVSACLVILHRYPVHRNSGNCLMLFREAIAVCTENLTKPISTVCGENETFLIILSENFMVTWYQGPVPPHSRLVFQSNKVRNSVGRNTLPERDSVAVKMWIMVFPVVFVGITKSPFQRIAVISPPS